jgi:ABC-type branched-subunit amino acid transport system ATPase component
LATQTAGRIEFTQVRFVYNLENAKAVLDGIDLTIAPGQTVAILGATGAGKTSLVHLVPRFYDVTAGSVRIDGVDVRDLAQTSLFQQIAIVPQETILFSGTVRENISYGAPNASEEAIVAAAHAAQAHDFVTKLPNGYDTHIEERGVNLSGGQKQRIAIARALLTQPRILILDDSTTKAETRAFNPAKNDLSGIVTVGARFRNAPDGSTLRWSSPTAGVLTIDSPSSATTRSACASQIVTELRPSCTAARQPRRRMGTRQRSPGSRRKEASSRPLAASYWSTAPPRRPTASSVG